MEVTPNKFLLTEDDGLPMRKSQSYATIKLDLLAAYMQIFNESMKDKPWSQRYYLDLQAGPGKNLINGSVVLGSPLLALTSNPTFTQFRFNEMDEGLSEALKQRVMASELRDRVKTYQSDANKIIDEICNEILEHDTRSKLRKQWPSLNLAFLDPQGLEIEWPTVKKLAQVKRMDMIINFSTMGINRLKDHEEAHKITRFFGTDEWQTLYAPSASVTVKRRAWIDFYRKRLGPFGYHIEIDPDMGGSDVAIKNSRNAQVYSMVFASKHPLGEEFWNKVAKTAQQKRLF